MIHVSRFRDALLDYARRPSMFGAPSSVEELGKHVSHVWLCTVRARWTFENTKTLWRDISRELGFGTSCAGDDEEHRLYRYWCWDDAEPMARAQVCEAFERIWAQMEPASDDSKVLKEWIRALLREPRLGGYPCDLEVTLYGLIALASGKEFSRFSAAFERERERYGGNVIRSLCSIGSEEEWDSRGPMHPLEFTSWPNVAAGIHEVVRCIENGS